MKLNYRTTLFLSVLLCLLPIVIGVYFLPTLPSEVASHWGINGQPDRWTSPNMIVFGTPILMSLIQLVTTSIVFYRYKSTTLPKIGYVSLWLIPVITWIIYLATIYYALGYPLDMSIVGCGIAGCLLITFGYFLPFTTLEQNKKRIYRRFSDEATYHTAMKQISYAMILGGFLIIASVFFSPALAMITILGSIIFILVVSLIVTYRNAS